MNVDLDRGVTIRTLPGGKRVMMYKDQPGFYFDAQGVECDAEEARLAGFDVKRLDFERRHQAQLRDAQRKLEQEHAMKLQEIERIMGHTLAGHTVDIDKGPDKLFRLFDESGAQVSIQGYQRKSDLMDLVDQAGASLGHDPDEAMGDPEPAPGASPSNGSGDGEET